MKLSERLAAADQPHTTAKRATRKPAKPTKDSPTRGEEWTATKRRVHEHIVAEIGPLLARGEGLDLEAEVQSRLDEALRSSEVKVTSTQRRKFVAEVTADILGYGPLEPLLADPDVTEVMVNGPSSIFIERDGVITEADARFTDDRHLRQVIDRIVAAVGRRVDESSPMCDARLPDGSRVNVILPPLSLAGPALTIRRFPES